MEILCKKDPIAGNTSSKWRTRRLALHTHSFPPVSMQRALTAAQMLANLLKLKNGNKMLMRTKSATRPVW